jgi:hypothetical protein
MAECATEKTRILTIRPRRPLYQYRLEPFDMYTQKSAMEGV